MPILLMLLNACGKVEAVKEVAATDIFLLVDTTDLLSPYPQSKPLLALYDFADYKDQAARFRFTCITDRQLNAVLEYSLPGVVPGKVNPEDEGEGRENNVVDFFIKVEGTIDSVVKHCRYLRTLPYSECFRTISHELQTLTNSSASRKILIVFSNLRENSDIFSCYGNAAQKLLQNNPEKVADSLSMACPLPANLSGIEIYLVYQPSDRIDDQVYLEMATIYKSLLESRGARVTIQTNSNQFN